MRQLNHTRIHDLDVLWRAGTDDELELEQIRQRSLFPPDYPIHRGDTVVDVGAHIGSFTLQAARLVGEEGQVVAYEPHPESYQILLANLAINGLSRSDVFAYPWAVKGALLPGSENGYLLHCGKTTRGHSVVSDSDRPVAIRVASASLCGLRGSEALVKLNCEGAEWEIVDSLSDSHLRRSYQWSIFYHEDLVPDHSYTEIVARLHWAGFEVEVRNRSERRGWILARRWD